MYVKEINEALDKEDLEAVWKLMFRRSAWINESKFDPREVEKLLQETTEIHRRLEEIQSRIKGRMANTIEHWHAVRAYGQWRV